MKNQTAKRVAFFLRFCYHTQRCQRGVAQRLRHLVWDQGIVSSSLTAPTNIEEIHHTALKRCFGTQQ